MHKHQALTGTGVSGYFLPGFTKALDNESIGSYNILYLKSLL